MFQFFKSRFLLDNDEGGGSGSGDQNENTDPQENTSPENWEDYVNSLPEGDRPTVQSLFEKSTSGLKSALQKERDNNKTLSRQLKAAAEKAEKGSELRDELNSLLEKVNQRELEARFYEKAHQKGVSNLKLALVAAQQSDLIQDGEVDWESFQKQFPELFKPSTTPKDKSKGGRKTENHSAEGNMNEWIRSQARR